MGKLLFVWCCVCGIETDCSPAQASRLGPIGKVCDDWTQARIWADHSKKSRDIFTCPGCKKTFGRVWAAEGRGKWEEMVVAPEDFDPGEGWRLVTHPDGCQQVHQAPSAEWPPTTFIERVVSPKSRRKRWCVVSRKPPERWTRALYAPKLAGPFPDLDGAKAAYLIIMAAG